MSEHLTRVLRLVAAGTAGLVAASAITPIQADDFENDPRDRTQRAAIADAAFIGMRMDVKEAGALASSDGPAHERRTGTTQSACRNATRTLRRKKESERIIRKEPAGSPLRSKMVCCHRPENSGYQFGSRKEIRREFKVMTAAQCTSLLSAAKIVSRAKCRKVCCKIRVQDSNRERYGFESTADPKYYQPTNPLEDQRYMHKMLFRGDCEREAGKILLPLTCLKKEGKQSK